jgi:endonuclease/exonuclease/phosphatase family metal-dependent hydrolase
LVALRDLSANRTVVVGVTHLKAGEHSKLRQKEMNELLEQANAFVAALLSKAQELPALVLCGDWNDTVGGAVEKEIQHHALAARLELQSAYGSCPPKYTVQELNGRWNMTKSIPQVPLGGYMDAIDFIYFSGASLTVTSSWQEPPFETVRDVEGGDVLGIPNSSYPSDHIAMACQLRWR